MKNLPRIFMFLGAILPLFLFIFPLWNIQLEAPQYPIPLGMDIYIYKFSDMNPNDIQNINLLNHYVGMKYIPETIPELTIFPIVIGFMSLVGIIISFTKKKKLYLTWFIVMVLLLAAGMYDFYLWEYDYGHTLDPKAIMKFTNPDGSIMGFQPPLYGSKDILNFRAHSYPQMGALFLATGLLFSLIAFVIKKKKTLY